MCYAASLARIIVYSIAPDGLPVPPSSAPTPVFSPLPSRVSTPAPDGPAGDYLSAPLAKKVHMKPAKAYLAGSKALDSLARLIASTESFFHPSNSGSWTADVSIRFVLPEATDNNLYQLTAFIKYIVYDFNKRASNAIDI